jgi:hypothetical protein
MKFYLPIFISLFFVLCFSQNLKGQERWLSGVLKDNSGESLIGANVHIKGTSNGTTTDVDGKYKIKCKVGDVLVVSYLGYNTQEIPVTWNLLRGKSTARLGKEIKIQTQDAFKASLKKSNQEAQKTPSFLQATKLKFDIQNFGYARQNLTKLNIRNNIVETSNEKPGLAYGITYKQDVSSVFIPKQRLPKLQNTFSQGRSISQQLQFQDANQGEVYSFGPKMNEIGLAKVDNLLFKSAYKFNSGLQLKTKINKHNINVNLNHTSLNDPFRLQRNNNENASIYHYYKNLSSFISYNSSTNNLADINGVYAKILMHHLLTPSHYDNQLAYKNRNQNFSGGAFSNPYHILNNDASKLIIENLSFGTSWKKKINSLDLESSFVSSKNKETYLFSKKHKNSLSSENSFTKAIKEQQLIWRNQMTWKAKPFLSLGANLQLSHNQLDFEMVQLHQELPDGRNILEQTATNNRLNLSNDIKYEQSAFKLKLSNDIHFSDLNGFELFQPEVVSNLAIHELFKTRHSSAELNLFATISSKINGQDLYYNNNSHNSLLINTESFQAYSETNELFLNAALKNERTQNFSIGLQSLLLRDRLFIRVKYFDQLNQQNIFPVLRKGVFSLQNSADVNIRGLETSIDFQLNGYPINYNFQLQLKHEVPRVTKVLVEEDIIPIAGFSDISNVLKVGEVPGAIYGSAWLKDSDGNRIIDEEGFPIQSPNSTIIGNPNPDLYFNLRQNFKINKISISLVLNGQLGGDYWDGTQAILDYYGRSKSSESLRTQSINFSGRLTDGSINDKNVLAYDITKDIQESIFQRFGFGGVAESYIKDASYISLKSLILTYRFNNKYHFFKDINISLYGNDLFQISKNKVRNPYANFLGNPSSSGLQFFNRPLQSELGLKLIFKI